jgi:hypothetical protein
MFPSQPQIGQDMAKERQQQAEWIRQAQSAAPAKTPRRSWSVPWRWIDASTRRLSGLIALFRIRLIKRLPAEEK